MRRITGTLAALTFLMTATVTTVAAPASAQPPRLTVRPVTVTEDTGDTVVAKVRVLLSSPSTKKVTVDYRTVEGTAVAPQDYAAKSGTLTFKPGVTKRVVKVTVKGDALDEGAEQFAVQLRNPTHAVLAGAFGVVTIKDNDPVPGVRVVKPAQTPETAAYVDFVVQLSRTSGRSVSVHYASSDGTATAGSDYTAATGTATINPGALRTHVYVPLIDDDAIEGPETATLTISSPSHATITTASATATINDDEESLVYDVARGDVASGTQVHFDELVVTAVKNVSGTVTRVWLELPTGGPGNIGFEYSAITADTTAANRGELQPGDQVAFTGTVTGRALTSVTEMAVTGTAAVPPALVVNQNQILNNPGLHNVLIRVDNVTAMETTSGDWLLDIGAYVTQYFFDLPSVTAGQTYTYVYGIADVDQAAKRVLPRSASDLGTTN
jgi:large repetitive protein